MYRSTVDDMVRATGAELVEGAGNARLAGVTTDSRRIEPGCVLVCFKGEKVDGNAFAASAVEAGAGAVVMCAEAPAELVGLARERGAAILRCEGDDPEEFLLRLAHDWRLKNPQWVVVGVTGSVGKTTTKDMLAAGLSTRYAVHATKGNLNNLIGLPLTVLSASPDDEVIVAEMGMNHKGEIERLSRAAMPTIALITNVGTSHIGLLGSRENIARAKAEIVCGMHAGEASSGARSLLVMTSDNDFAPLIESECASAGVEVSYVGTLGSVVAAQDVRLDEEGMPVFDLVFEGGDTLPAHLGVPGRHVVADFLLAMAVCDRLGVSRILAAKAVATMPQTHMRLEVVGGTDGKPRIIDDSYNASPSSIAAALDVLCSMPCEGWRVAVLGEVGELGDQAERLHGLIGAYAAAKPLDLLVFVGTGDAAHAAEAARTMGFSEDHMEVVPTAQDAARVLGPILGKNDLVLAKGSRSVGLDAFVREVLA